MRCPTTRTRSGEETGEQVNGIKANRFVIIPYIAILVAFAPCRDSGRPASGLAYNSQVKGTRSAPGSSGRATMGQQG
jgi:hypothetical protein